MREEGKTERQRDSEGERERKRETERERGGEIERERDRAVSSKNTTTLISAYQPAKEIPAGDLREDSSRQRNKSSAVYCIPHRIFVSLKKVYNYI